MSDLRSLLAEGCRPFSREIAQAAARWKAGYERIYRLKDAANGIACQAQEIEVYDWNNQCFIIAEETATGAWDVNDCNPHGLVRTLLDETDYVLTYVDRDAITDEQAALVGLGTNE